MTSPISQIMQQRLHKIQQRIAQLQQQLNQAQSDIAAAQQQLADAQQHGNIAQVRVQLLRIEQLQHDMPPLESSLQKALHSQRLFERQWQQNHS